MHILQDIRELKTGERELRKFGWLVGGVFAGIGLFLWWRHKPYFPYLLTPGLVLVAFGFLFPKVLRPVYLVWMSLAIVLGFVVSHVILTVFFFLVILPIGLAARLAGKDFLSLKLQRDAATYWIRREVKEKKPEEYEQQF